MIRRPLNKIREPEIWKHYIDDIYVSDQGRAKKVINGKEYAYGYFSRHKSKQMHCIKVRGKNYALKNIVYKVFKGDIPKGYYVVHKNGLKRDDSVYNLEAVSKQEHGHRVGKRGNAQPVANLDKKILYRSASEAGRKLHCSRQAISGICNGQRKDPMFNLAWWDEENEKCYRGKWRCSQ